MNSFRQKNNSHLTDHFYVASRLSKISNAPEETERITEYFKKISHNAAEQTAFFNYCLKWKLAPWVNLQLQRTGYGEFFNLETLWAFQTAYDKVDNDNEHRNAEALIFLKEFKKAGIDVIILKGNLFAHNIYHDAGYKRMNDFDILVHPEDWIKIQQIYFNLGYIPLGFGWSGEKQKAAKFSHTGIPFISANFKCIIGTQWGLKSPTTNYRVNIDEAWKTARPFDFYGLKVKQLSPEYNLLHLILHMGIFKCGIRDCMDVYNLILAEKMNDDNLISLLERSNAFDKASFTLELCNHCSDTVGKNLLSQLKTGQSSFLAKRLKAREKVILESGDIHTSYNDYFQDVEKNVMYFNIVNKFHERGFFYLKILKQIFWPDMETCLKFIDKTHQPGSSNKRIARLKAPYFVFALIAQEIGWKITFILFFKLFFDQMISLIYYAVPKETYFDYLEKKGIDPKQIKNAVANVQ